MKQNCLAKKLLAAALMVAVVLVLLFSEGYSAKHANHTHCDKDDCQICLTLARCEANIKTITTAIIIAFVGLLLFAPVLKSAASVEEVFLSNSLISQKIRMNN